MKNSKEIVWRCLNYGGCEVADESEQVHLPAGTEFLCPKCGGNDGIRLKAKRPNYGLFGLIGGGVAMLVLILVLLLKGGGENGNGGNDPPPPPPPLVEIPTPLRYPNGIERQVLVRPDSVLYREQQGSEEEDKKPKSFDRYFVYGDDPQSDRLWVGSSRVAVDGWMMREDVMDWPHSTIVAFNEMGNRHPVLFFRELDPLRKIAESPDPIDDEIAAMYANIESHIARGEVLPADYPVISIEPRRHSNESLIMPVLEAHMPEDSSLGRMLRVTVAGESRGETNFQSERYVELLRKFKEEDEARMLSEMRVDVDLVFVIDMTGTMQPWVDGLLDSVKSVISEIDGHADANSNIRFGLWGYQDQESLPGIQFLTRNFTPSLMGGSDFRNLLETIKVNRMTTDRYPEDVFAGMTDAIRRTSWRDEAQGVIILIGDAPGHSTVTKGHIQGGREDIDAPQVRQLATDAGVQIASIAIKDSSNSNYVQYHAQLVSQFMDLSRNPGFEKPSFIEIDQTGSTTFRSGMEQLLGILLKQPDTSSFPDDEPISDAVQIGTTILERARARIVSAQINESGEPMMPRDIDGWVYELDLLDPSVRALEPKLLVTRAELNTLVNLASEVVRKLEEAAILGSNFYDQLLVAVAGAASGGRASGEAVQLPAFLQGLPYQSDMMGKSAEWFQALDGAGQQQFISQVKAKLNYYRMVYETPALWRSLSQGATERDQVAEIPFSQLP